MALAPPKSGLFVGLPRSYAGASQTDTTPVPVSSSAVLTLGVSVGPVTNYSVIQRSTAALSLGIQLSAVPIGLEPELPDPGAGYALLIDSLGNYLVDSAGNFLSGKI